MKRIYESSIDSSGLTYNDSDDRISNEYLDAIMTPHEIFYTILTFLELFNELTTSRFPLY